MRHNVLRNTEAHLMKEVCRDVQIEPTLLPINAEELRAQTNNAPGARLDVSARGVWNEAEKTFFDVRVTHTHAESNRGKTLAQIYREHENEKKNLYNERIIDVEKSSFTPLVFTTTGGMGPECEKLNKKLSELISIKRNETYSQVMKHVRTRLRFALLKTTIVALRGYRGKPKHCEDDGDMGDIAYNLIPSANCYETA